MMKYLLIIPLIIIGLLIVISCSGGGGGITPIPTIDDTTIPTFPTFSTTTTFPTFSTTTNTTNTYTTYTTSNSTTWTTTTTNNTNQKYLYVKVLRRTANNDIEWLGYGWNNYAYVNFRSQYNPNNDKQVYVNDGYYGTGTFFQYDTYRVNYVDIGIYRYYLDYDDYEVRVGNNYENSSQVWYGIFTVNFYNPNGNSIYIVFRPGVTTNMLRKRKNK